jgi:DNA-directed RNA polymerase-3 subunit RPC5
VVVSVLMLITYHHCATDPLLPEELHLTQVTGVAQMRPQFHHIDAQAEINKSKTLQSQRPKGAGRATEARVVQQIARATGANGEEFQFTKTAEFLTKASEEPWTRLRYVDEDVCHILSGISL